MIMMMIPGTIVDIYYEYVGMVIEAVLQWIESSSSFSLWNEVEEERNASTPPNRLNLLLTSNKSSDITN
jgi:hypothetical protein